MKTRIVYFCIAALFCSLAIAFPGCKKDTTYIDYLRPSKGDTTTLVGIYNLERADSAAYSVYLDLSKEVKTSVLRSAWDLGFYCSTDTFRVIINHALGATVLGLDKTDLNAVGVSDSSTHAAEMILNETSGNAATVDPVTGTRDTYLSGTKILEISATAALNKVYILNRGAAPGIKARQGLKFRIQRQGNGYTITYGTLSASSYSTLTLNKDAAYNFKYLSFSSSTVSVEPAKKLWDLEFTATTYQSGTTPVFRPDFMLINFVGGVTAAQVMVADKSYESFTASDISAVTFSGARDAIGTSWFNLTATTLGGYSILTDRFYLIKDALGNIYKLNFFGGGSRGKPIVAYDILVDNEPKN